ncbi:MAG: 2-oxo acid dehydrogenase subunit E2, partial [Chitinophagales bacterium]|nr:2-oxo acid dehydrogenase subunit E2 [Chitinophagales bacterium]MDW8428098.1 2-oxo acid dehydrogenase subunit E2 [Chitinophagales bacterium]
MIEVRVPSFGESITEVTLSRWLKNDGDLVALDEPLCELESEKATSELPAEQAGRLKIQVPAGSVVAVGDVIAWIEPHPLASPEVPSPDALKSQKTLSQKLDEGNEEQEAPQPQVLASPAAAKLMRETGIRLAEGSGKKGRITKADVLRAQQTSTTPQPPGRTERRERMSTLRKTISKHLVAARNTTAMLTTFNEVDMKNIMELRSRYKEAFQQKHGVGLGLMSFFIKACCYALKAYPILNARIDGDDIVY